MNYKRKSRRRFFLLMRSRTPPISSWIPLWNSNGADSHFCHYAYVTSWLGEKKNYHCGGDSWREGLFTKQLKKISESRILVRLLRMYFPRNWEFGSALSKLRNFGEGFEPPNPPSVRHWCRVVSCRVVLCRVVSCCVVWYCVVSCPVVLCRVVSCCVVSCLVILCCVASCPVVLFRVVSCYVVFCCVMLCCVVSCLVLLWCVV